MFNSNWTDELLRAGQKTKVSSWKCYLFNLNIAISLLLQRYLQEIYHCLQVQTVAAASCSTYGAACDASYRNITTFLPKYLCNVKLTAMEMFDKTQMQVVFKCH